MPEGARGSLVLGLWVQAGLSQLCLACATLGHEHSAQGATSCHCFTTASALLLLLRCGTPALM